MSTTTSDASGEVAGGVAGDVPGTEGVPGDVVGRGPGLSVPAIDVDADVLTAALAYAAAGWYLGPLDAGTKHPGSILGKGWQLATSRDPELIVTWFAGAGSGVGVFLHVGRSGGTVLDCDRPQLVPPQWSQVLAVAPFQASRIDDAARGHYVFATPPGLRIGSPKWAAGEVRGTNGVIVVAPTPHALVEQGGRYRWLRTGPVPVLPEMIATTLPRTQVGGNGAGLDGGNGAGLDGGNGAGLDGGGLDGAGVASDADVRAALAGWTGTARPTALRAVVKHWDDEVGGAGASRHNTLVEALCWAAREARAGAYPLGGPDGAVGALWGRWSRDITRALGGGRVLSPAQAQAEFAGALAWAVGRALDAAPDRIEAIRVRTTAKRPGGTDGCARMSDPTRAVTDRRTDAATATSVDADAAAAARVDARVDARAAVINGEAIAPAVAMITEARAGVAQAGVGSAGVAQAGVGSAGVGSGTGDGVAAASADQPRTNLPAQFWDSRAALSVIRVAASARVLSPDAVLGCVLARLAAFIRPGVRIDTGLGRASANLAVVVVGDSSAGKSEAWRAARDLLPAPMQLSGMPDNDGLPLGSGEGLAEAFYGMAEESTGETYASGPRKGEDKTKLVRKKMHEHALFFADEGEALLRMGQRLGSTINPELRKAWKAETLGQANASAERRRIVPDGTYAMSVVLGFQPGTIGPLFDDEAGGTPQRFLFLSAHSDTVGDEVVDWPGPLRNVAHGLPTQDLVLPDAAKAVLRAARVAARRVGAPPSGLNGHTPLHLAKLSALMAVLDLRTEVNEADWGLALQLWRTSCVVRDGLVERFAVERARRRAAEDDRKVEVAARSAVAGEAASAALVVRRVARRVALAVHDRGVRTLAGREGLRNTLAGRDRPHLDEAVTEAVRERWIVTEGDQIRPGSERPV